jgi:hypothetical protein
VTEWGGKEAEKESKGEREQGELEERGSRGGEIDEKQKEKESVHLL